MKTLRNLTMIVAALAALISAKQASSANLTAAQTDSILATRGYEAVVPVFPGTTRFVTGAYGGIDFLNIKYGAPIQSDAQFARAANEGYYCPDVDSVGVPGESSDVRAYDVPDTTDDANIAERWIQAIAVPPVQPTGVESGQNLTKPYLTLKLISQHPAYGHATFNKNGKFEVYNALGQLKNTFEGDQVRFNSTGMHFVRYTPTNQPGVDKSSHNKEIIRVLNIK